MYALGTLYFKNWLFFCCELFSTALVMIVVLLLFVYVLNAWRKLCFINKHVGSVEENVGARHVTYMGEEPRATSTVMATLPAVHIHYSEYIGLSFTLHTTSRLFIRHILLKEKTATPHERTIYNFVILASSHDPAGRVSLFTLVTAYPSLLPHTLQFI